MNDNQKNDFNGFSSGNEAGETDNYGVNASSRSDENFWSDNEGQGNSISQSEFEQDLPSLSAGASQGLNKKGIIFLLCVAIVGFGGAAVLYKKFTGGEGTSKAVVRETEVIAAAPPERVLPPTLPPVPQEQTSIDLIDDTPALPVNESSAQPVEVSQQENDAPKEITLAERRALNSGTVIDSDMDGNSLTDRGRRSSSTDSVVEEGGDSGAGNIKVRAVSRIRNADTLLGQGTFIRCILETKLVSDFPGMTSCVVTNPVYSINGKTLLIEKGSRVFGQYGSEGEIYYERAAVIWNRIVTPSGRDVQLKSPGIDSLGGSGHPGEVIFRWGQRLGAALLVTMVGDVFNYAGKKWGPTVQTTTRNSDGTTTTNEESFDSKTADVLPKFAEKMLDKTMNRSPTLIINQGTVINIFTAKDIDFRSVVD